MLLQALPLLAILPLSLAKVISVDVGNGGLVFSPDTITAEKGDSIVFTFYPQSHDVVESTFDKPCSYKSGGIFSGVSFSTSNGPSSKIFTVNIDNSDTRWLYCSVGGHCQQGMSLVINQKDQTLKDYKAASGSAASANNNPSSPSGGTVSDKAASSSGSSSVTAKAASSTSASASSASASASSVSSSSGTAASVTSSSSASKASATSGTAAITSSSSASKASASATSTGAASKVGAGAALGIAGMLLGGLI